MFVAQMVKHLTQLINQLGQISLHNKLRLRHLDLGGDAEHVVVVDSPGNRRTRLRANRMHRPDIGPPQRGKTSGMV